MTPNGSVSNSAWYRSLAAASSSVSVRCRSRTCASRTCAVTSVPKNSTPVSVPESSRTGR